MQKIRSGFTFLELMIVVAIIGILAAIAIPNFMMFQLRNKVWQEADRSIQDTIYFQNDWARRRSSFLPEYTETASYLPTYEEGFSLTTHVTKKKDAYIIIARGDLDGDGKLSYFGYVNPGPYKGSPEALREAFGVGMIEECSVTGMYSPQTEDKDRVKVIGPCREEDGMTVF